MLTTWIVAVDASLIIASFITVDRIYAPFAKVPPVTLLWMWAMFGYFVSALALKLYSLNVQERMLVVVERIARSVARAVIIVAIALFLLATSREVSRVVFVGGFALSLIALLAHRGLATRHYRVIITAAGPGTLLIVDDADPIAIRDVVAVSARDHPELQPDTGNPESLDRFARSVAPYDRVMVTCSPARRRAWAQVLQGAHIDGHIVAAEMLELKAVGVDLSGDVGKIVVSTPGMDLHERVLKRMLDVAIAGAALVMLSPVLVAIAAAIKFEDGGPIFFHQRRIGRANRFFTVLKFRSMKTAALNPAATVLTQRGDDRVTRVGGIIRAMSLDELPQLLNILVGQMSVVGPRPHALGARAGSELYWEVSQQYWHRHVVKPGLTGLAQVRGFRGPTDARSDLEKRLRADLEYVAGWTVWRDLAIILRTAFVMRHQNAF